jgi:hypothetical protein
MCPHASCYAYRNADPLRYCMQLPTLALLCRNELVALDLLITCITMAFTFIAMVGEPLVLPFLQPILCVQTSA